LKQWKHTKANNLCSKAGRPILNILANKHPPLCNPPSVREQEGAFEPYKATLPSIPICITAKIVEKVASQLSGPANPGNMDAVDLQNWLLHFRKKSKAL
jgi:hypothetical protein